MNTPPHHNHNDEIKRKYFASSLLAKELGISGQSVKNICNALGITKSKSHRYLLSDSERDAVIRVYKTTQEFGCTYDGAIRIISYNKKRRGRGLPLKKKKDDTQADLISDLLAEWLSFRDWGGVKKLYTAQDMAEFAMFSLKSQHPKSVSTSFRVLPIERARAISRNVCEHVYGVDPEKNRKSPTEIEASNAHFFLLREWGLSSKDTSELLSGVRDRSTISVGASKFASSERCGTVLKELEIRIGEVLLKDFGIKR
jgi:hypothetical protein